MSAMLATNFVLITNQLIVQVSADFSFWRKCHRFSCNVQFSILFLFQSPCKKAFLFY